MQSPIVLVFASALVETLQAKQLPHFCSWPVSYALAQLYTLPQGKLIRQSFSSFLAHIDVFEYLLEQDTVVSYSRSEPSLYMLLMFDGNATSYLSQQQQIADNVPGAFHMGYINSGDYTSSVKAGKTKIVLLTLRAEWLMRKASILTQLAPITAHYSNAEGPNYYLPDCPISLGVSNLTEKMLLHDGIDHGHLDGTIIMVMNQLIIRYHDMLDKGLLTTHALHQKRASEIAAYVSAYYMNQDFDDIQQLASRFHLSERQLLRLAKKAFQMPLHQYIISVRMNRAIVKLVSSDKPVHEVAAEVGYPNSHYFSTAFKKYHGISPSEVRGLCLPSGK